MSKKQLKIAQIQIEKALNLIISARDTLGKLTYTEDSINLYKDALNSVKVLSDLNSNVQKEMYNGNCEINWTIWFACDRDGGGETHKYRTDLCKDCVPFVVKLLRSADINVEESHHEF
jgi:glucuronate isomerase